MLITEELSFQYTGSKDWALKDVSLEIKKGECILLAGSSGCGKSTLIKCFNGLVPHFERGMRAGRVLLDGTDIAQMSMYEISQRTGAVFQNPRSQFFTTHVIDEIAFGCENSGIPREVILDRIEDVMERFGIQHLRARKIFDLSSGEQQKVILASVYAMGVDIWVMDEPSANLDDSSIKKFRETVGFLKKEGKTIIIAEHRYHYLKEHIDRVVVLEKGRVSEDHEGNHFYSKNSHFHISEEKTGRLFNKTGNQVPENSADIFSDTSLAVDNLAYHYSKSHAPVLEGVKTSFKSGEITALTGDNGSGKTTLAMIITGLIKECNGGIKINGLTAGPGERIKRCRMVLQEADHQLFTESVYRELEIGLSDGGKDLGKITRILQKISLESKLNQRPHSLSGGEKQRLAVAAALAADPEILILDEPTSGLDVENMMRMGRLLNNATRRGAIVIVITNDNEFIKNCCTRVLRMKKGGIINE